MAAFRPLTEFLASAQGNEISVTFAEVEQLLHRPLPDAAYTRRWWRNDPRTPRARSWLEAGWMVSDAWPRGRRVTFVRHLHDRPPPSEQHQDEQARTRQGRPDATP